MIEQREEIDLDLFAFISKLWNHKKFIIKSAIVGGIVGVVIAFSIPKEYTTTVIFTASGDKPSSRNIASLASLAGVNINNSEAFENLSPELYPSIMGSTPFIRTLLDINVRDANLGVDTTLYVYLKDMQKKSWMSYAVGLPSILTGLFKTKSSPPEIDAKGQQNYYISAEEMSIINLLKDSYTISNNKKAGTIVFNVTLQSPAISAFLADTLTSYLQKYIIFHRTKKAHIDLESTKKLYLQTKTAYDEQQQKLAAFIDANQNIVSAQYKIKQSKLENDRSLSYSLYMQMAQQLQAAEMKVQYDTPFFTIIQPAVQPIYPSKPSKKIILAFFLLISILASSIWIVRKDLYVILTKKE